MAEEDPPSSTALTPTKEWTLPERDEASVRKLGFAAGSNTLVLSFEDDSTLGLPSSEIQRFEYGEDEERKRLLLVRQDGSRAVLNRFGMSRQAADRLVEELNAELEGRRTDAKLAPLLDVRDAVEGSAALTIHSDATSGYRQGADPRRLRLELSSNVSAGPKPGYATPRSNTAFAAAAPVMIMIAFVVAIAIGLSSGGGFWLSALVALPALVLFVNLLRRVPKVGEFELTEHELRLRSTRWPFRGTQTLLLRRIVRIELVPFALLPPILDKGLAALNLVEESGTTLAQVPLALDAADRLRLFTALSRHLASSRRDAE